MRIGIRLLWAVCLLAGMQAGARAQAPLVGGVPADVYYLLPAFADGVVYITGQGPAQGEMNICAVDNSLRFKDKDGQELEASEPDKIISAVIGDAYFIRSNGVFYRKYPVSGDIGIALKREVIIRKDVKRGAYGMEDQTSSIREYSTIYADGVTYQLNQNKAYPYNVTETLFLCQGNAIFPLNKKNLKKLFPDRKDDIEAWFKARNNLPDTVDGLSALLAGWASAETSF